LELVVANNVSRKYAKTLASKRRHGLGDVCRAFFGLPDRSGKLHEGEFWALSGVSFSVKRGEALGLLGLNGAGKSTLLKILAGRLAPSTGQVVLRGTMNAMLELGSGFAQNLSGRENIRLLCSMKGLSSQQIASVTEEIVEFAELGEFIDSPVSFYSSGMRSRLAFGIAIVTKPDVLLIDEVLSVGDFKFRQKCLDFINRLRNNCAIVLVSHSAATIRMFCNTAIVLEKGQKVFDGDAKTAVDLYHQYMEQQEAKKAAADRTCKEDIRGTLYYNKRKLKEIRCRWVNELGEVTQQFHREDAIRLEFELCLDHEARSFFIGIPIWSSDDIMVTAFNSDLDGVKFLFCSPGLIRASLTIFPCLNPDIYRAALAIHDGPEYLARIYLPDFEVLGRHERVMGLTTPMHGWAVDAT
jgi:ABC-type polysaccharide/polyol phosphate transport system ATPase subunit